MEDERALEGSKLHEDLDFTARAQQRRIVLEAVFQWRKLTIDALKLVRFEVNVDGVPPSAPWILQNPAFCGTDRRRRVGKTGIEESLVDLPGPLAPHELEGASANDLTRQDRGMLAQRCSHLDRRAVGLWRSLDNELDERKSWNLRVAILKGSAWTSPIRLKEDVFQIEFVGCVGEVDHHVGPRASPQQQGLAIDGLWIQPRVSSETDERLAVAEP